MSDTNIQIDPVLATANPRTLEQLMELDPLHLTKDDITSIIVALRKARIEWEKVEQVKKTSGTRTEKAAKKKAEATALLSELGFDF